jgi:PAS domain S-box-containing protein
VTDPVRNLSPLAVSPRRRAALAAGLAGLAVLGNHFHLPLFYGVDFIFSSIFALIALSLLGLAAGVFVAAAGGVYTLLLWGHPYALVVLVLEVIAVGLLQRRLNQLALADALYWLFAGVPLVLAFYHWPLGMDWTQALLVASKQSLNSIFNAVIACLAMLGMLSRTYREGAHRDRRVSIANLMFNTLLAATLLAGLLPVVVDSRAHRVEREREVDAQLERVAGRIAQALQRQPGDFAAAFDAAQLPEQASAALLAAGGETLAERGSVRSLRPGGSFETAGGGTRVWLPEGDMTPMQRWHRGQYVHDQAHAGPGPVARVVVEQAAAPLVGLIERQRLHKLGLLALLTLAAVAVAALLSRSLTGSIRKLEALSRNLPERIASGATLAIGHSRVAEYDSLAASIRAMAETLSASFRAVHEMRDGLEDRVRERTADLARREAMLAESEARFRNMADAAPALIWLSDTGNQGIWYNRRWLEYTGRGMQQELGLGWAEGMHPDDLERCVAYCNAAFAARRPFEMEFRLRRADGSYGWIADTGIPRFNAAGDFEGYIGYCWEITDRKEAELALRRQQHLGEVIARAQSQFIREVDRGAAFEGLLADILDLTDSEYGIIGELLHAPDGTPFLRVQAIFDITWDEATRDRHLPGAPEGGVEIHDIDTLFGAAVTGGAPVIDNAPGRDPRRSGLPHARAPLTAFLGLPILAGEQAVAVLGLANRAGGYDRAQIDFLRPLLATLGQLVEAMRFQRRREEDQTQLARLSLVASQTTNGVIITDTEGRIEWINEGFTRISGYTLHDLRGLTPGSVLQGPDSDAGTVAHMRAALQRREPFQVELINYGKDGRPYWIRISCNPLLDAAGNPQGFMAIQSDVTEEKLAAERLRDSERRLSAVIEGTHIGTWEWNVQTGATVFNARWAEIVGYALEELAPISIQTWVNLAHPDDLQQSNQLLQRHFAGELDYYDIECRMRHKDGHWVWVHDRGRVVSWTADGKPLLMSGTHADISEQKQAEASLRASEEKYRSLVVNIPGAAYQCAMDSNWTVLYISDAIEALTGYPAQEFIGNAVRSYASVIHPDDATLGNQAMHDAIAAGEPWAIEYRLCHRDGSVRWVYEKGQAVRGEGGEILWLSGFIHDITERKRMERMKDEFISTVSHELRTPLTSISGALGLLAGGATGALPGKALELIGIAHKNSTRLTHLINDLLDMEKLAAGKLSFDLQVQELMPLVEQSLQDNHPYAAQYGVTLVLAARCDGVQVRVDALRLQQVLANFLSNAAKFSPEGGTVEIAVTRRDALVRVAVTDHGPGIPAEFRPYIFEKFSQADASDARQRGGTGLGLAISKELAERMHGTVGFDSEPGRGASFHFDLPVW